MSGLLTCIVSCLILALIGQASNADERNGACPEAAELLKLSEKIDSNGAFRGTVNYAMNERVLALAGCYTRTGDPLAAKVVATILMRYADVVRSWPIIGLDGSAQMWHDFTAWDFGGFWGGNWVYDDLKMSANLARAFSLISDSGALKEISQKSSTDAKVKIREDLLRYLVDFNLRFGRGAKVGTNTVEATFPFTNMDPYRLKGLIAFGKAIDPAYVHIAVHFLRLFPTVGFFRDGFWHEGTFSYHKQVVEALDDVIADLKGYSDPPGYTHVKYTTLFNDEYQGEPGRFDNLDPEGETAPSFARMRVAGGIFRLPNGRMLVRNDSHHFDTGNGLASPTSSQCLLGLRHCILVYGKGDKTTIVHLNLGGTEGHEHLSALNLELWSLNRLLVGGAAYKGHSDRDWNASTAAHNTVVIDGRSQDSRWDDRQPLTPFDLIPGLGNYLWQGYGQGDTENNGDLVAADLGGNPVQYLSSDATRAYDAQSGASKYRRTLLLVGNSNNHTYLLDVFEVVGGNRHDWMLHGDLSEDPNVQTSLREQAAKATLGPFLHVARLAEASGPWNSVIAYADGRELRTYYAEPAISAVAIARGPAQMRRGDASYLSIARDGPRNAFIAVHVPEQVGKTSPVKKVELLLQTDVELKLRISLENGRTDDIIVANAPGDNARITHIATADDGRCQWRYNGDLATPTREWRGQVIGVERKDFGGKANGIRVSDWPAAVTAPPPAFLHVQPHGKHAVQSFVIRSVTKLDDGGAFIEVDGDPGFEIRTEPDGKSMLKLLYYPSRGFLGQAAYRTTTNEFRPC